MWRRIKKLNSFGFSVNQTKEREKQRQGGRKKRLKRRRNDKRNETVPPEGFETRRRRVHNIFHFNWATVVSIGMDAGARPNESWKICEVNC